MTSSQRLKEYSRLTELYPHRVTDGMEHGIVDDLYVQDFLQNLQACPNQVDKLGARLGDENVKGEFEEASNQIVVMLQDQHTRFRHNYSQMAQGGALQEHGR